MNNTLNLNEDKFKDITANLLDSVTNHHGKITHSQMLQMLSQAIYSKPYEEIEKTLFEKKLKEVLLFECNGTYFVFVGKKCIFISNEHIPTETIIKKVRKEKGMAEFNEKIVSHPIPFVLDGKSVKDYSEDNNLTAEEEETLKPKTSQVFKIAKQLGYFDNNLISVLENAEKIFVNGMLSAYHLSDDIYAKVSEEGEDACIWFPEMNIEDEYFEFFFTLKELSEAEYNSKDNIWYVTQKYDNEEVIQTIKVI
ncbi:MAG: hypothetical protein CL760_06615 [Chloroflexi bacterium]|nr:hypothetical protein [Chloroflexota bacterium]|tara:strand:+ start:25689 stop:26444 length:756 start_codon:yes stop_codon:yes gene_type:complete